MLLGSILPAFLAVLAAAARDKDRGPPGVSLPLESRPIRPPPRPRPPVESSTSDLVFVPTNYTVTVYNSDCPCHRPNLRFCTIYYHRVLDHHCYHISHYAASMTVADPLIADTNRLTCRIFPGLRCDGAGLDLTFADNTACREPKFGRGSIEYRSFVCSHEGWTDALM